jgi:tetratricopeptide (TPR) repeat protein
MQCDQVLRDEIADRYLLDALSEQDREAFEEHFFECARCFDELQALQSIRGGLRQAGSEITARTTRPFFSRPSAAALAAAVVLAAGVAVWLRPTLWPVPPEATKGPSPPQVQSPGEQSLRQPEGPVVSGPSLEQLARVEAPRYKPPALRGAPDDATTRFQRGMEHYRQADYRRAAVDLRAAAELDPDAAHIRFFLGVTHLMLGQDTAAIDSLRATIALGDSAYLEEAHFYLAKAFLRQKDLAAAEAQLKTLIQLRGSGGDEARRLLSQVERLMERSR